MAKQKAKKAGRSARGSGEPPPGLDGPPDAGQPPARGPAGKDVELEELEELHSVDEMTLRAVAVALLSSLPMLLSDDPATRAALAAEIARVLGLPPGRARDQLLHLLLEQAGQRLRSWVLDQLKSGLPRDHARVLPRMWLAERDQDDPTPLVVGTAYTAVLTIGEEGPDRRYGELSTRWAITSRTVRLEAQPDDPDIVVSEQADKGGWLATFEMRLPEDGDDPRRWLRITPVVTEQAQLEADVYIGGDLYRQLTLSFTVTETDLPDADSGPRVTGPAVAPNSAGTLDVAHVGLVPAAPWQRSRRNLTVGANFSTEPQAIVSCEELGITKAHRWPVMPGDVEPRIANVRQALNSLRQAFPNYFESITAERLAKDLAAGPPPETWADRNDDVCPGPFLEQWSAVAESRELRNLAHWGHQLYRAVFDESLRACIDQLEPGDRINVVCLDEAGVRPHLPLPLMYTGEVPPDEPVDPTRFLGLRHRIQYTRRGSEGTRALGSWKSTTRAHILYEATQASDAVAAESRRHADELSRWATSDEHTRFLPRGAPLTAVSQFLDSPGPSPVSVLYFYCHCVSGDGTDPYLRLGPTNADTDTIHGTDMGTKPFEDRPLVFVNACASSAADPMLANQLMASFLDRRCRAHIGTEGPVPPGVAARFATIFFTALYGTAWDVQAPVGEAVTQARRFLWHRYRNLGGLFYSQVNDYALYAAQHDHVADLQPSNAPGTEVSQ